MHKTLAGAQCNQFSVILESFPFIRSTNIMDTKWMRNKANKIKRTWDWNHPPAVERCDRNHASERLHIRFLISLWIHFDSHF